MMILYLPLGSASDVCAYLLCRVELYFCFFMCVIAGAALILNGCGRKKNFTRFPSKCGESTDKSRPASSQSQSQARTSEGERERENRSSFFSSSSYFIFYVVLVFIGFVFICLVILLLLAICVLYVFVCTHIRTTNFLCSFSAPKVIFISNTFLFFYKKIRKKKLREYPTLAHTRSWSYGLRCAPYSQLECVYMCVA